MLCLPMKRNVFNLQASHVAIVLECCSREYLAVRGSDLLRYAVCKTYQAKSSWGALDSAVGEGQQIPLVSLSEKLNHICPSDELRE